MKWLNWNPFIQPWPSLNEALANESKSLQDDLKREKERVSEMWKMNCAQLAGFDEALPSKEAEISALKERISLLEGMVDTGMISPIVSSSPAITAGVSDVAWAHEAPRRRGKLHPLASSLEKIPSTSLVIGCCDWNEQASGMLGRQRRS